MSDFDDPELERILGRSGGPFPDVNLAYQQVQTRVRRAKRRRAAVMGGTACSLLLALGVLAAVRGGDGRSIQPGGSSELTGPDGSQLQPRQMVARIDITNRIEILFFTLTVLFKI